jgi:ABC-2 type transport system permease protein
MRKKPAHPLLELTLARLLEFVREPEAIFWVFVFPVLLAVALGIAFRVKPADPYRVALVGSAAPLERASELLRAVPGIAAQPSSEHEASDGLRAGKLDLMITATDDAAAALGAPLRLTFHFDPTRPESRAARLAIDDALQRGAGRLDVVEVRDQTATTRGGRYIDFLIPGLVGLNIMGSSMWGIGYSVVLARRNKLLKRLAATPMRRAHYLLSFMLSRMLFLVPEVAAVVAFGWIVFGVAIHGSVLGVGLVSLLGGLAFMGLAMLVAARTDNTEVASGWMNAIQMPMWLLGGAFFSYQRFPEVVHPFIRLLPLTAFNDALRALMNEGAPLWSIWSELLVMTVWGAISFALALRVFRWR